MNYHRRVFGYLSVCALLVVFYWRSLSALVSLGINSDVLSYVLLVPFISTYLIHVRRRELSQTLKSSPGLAALASGFGLAALGIAWVMGGDGAWFARDGVLSFVILSFLCFLVSGAFVCLGKAWLAAAAFPVAFLFFIIPLSNGVIDALETASKLASAEAAELLFSISGTPYLREGNIFQLPGIIVEVAQECSGIRSSLVLIITSLLAANMFLKSPWRRAVLVALVIPLGILRNGFRIMVIGMLCVYEGPHMIDSPIHHQGGPVFFALSLIPLFLVLWGLRRGESRLQKQGDAKPAIASDPARR